MVGNAVCVMQIATGEVDVTDRLWSLGDRVAVADRWDDSQIRKNACRKPKRPPE